MYRENGESMLETVKGVSNQQQGQKSRSRNIGQDFIDDFAVVDFPISREEEVAMESSPNAYFF